VWHTVYAELWFGAWVHLRVLFVEGSAAWRQRLAVLVLRHARPAPRSRSRSPQLPTPMKKLPVVLGVALGFALLVTGCETDALSARIQEKSAVYATLKPWQKKYVDTGVVAMGFTPDMVYMAIGNPTKTEIVGAPENKT